MINLSGDKPQVIREAAQHSQVRHQRENDHRRYRGIAAGARTLSRQQRPGLPATPRESGAHRARTVTSTASSSPQSIAAHIAHEPLEPLQLNTPGSIRDGLPVGPSRRQLYVDQARPPGALAAASIRKGPIGAS